MEVGEEGAPVPAVCRPGFLSHSRSSSGRKETGELPVG